ncbi:Response regulator receiver domain-containing protein [Desulfacinum infernum DSM 9756]|uniref:Response regulator receiver domain-containing protein n=1 Tax=Desulfacinum infernum DSM 9756 TaxID=1121391 RepID=A0A1M5F5N2_9BACT|nr:response regulator [Desulfacinum infernum]MBC7357212.1 response regulator [Desulfacinum sp.]SHF86894.1 Response regulator receiver domain-containing protein [Desulfacinum infernum DSM 9756]
MDRTMVLLVDDEVPFVETMTKRLGKRGFHILKAFNGPQALEVLDDDDKVDVVILDVKMPGMDGIETLREIRKRRPLVEVIMLTGHATVETAIEGMRLGAFDYLMKPCDIEDLSAKVQEAKKKKARHEQKILEAKAHAIALRRGD